VGELRLLASARSPASSSLPGGARTVRRARPRPFAGLDLVFFAAGGAGVQRVRARRGGRRRHRHRQVKHLPHGPALPLVGARVTPRRSTAKRHQLPRPMLDIQMVVALKPIYDAVGTSASSCPRTSRCRAAASAA